MSPTAKKEGRGWREKCMKQALTSIRGREQAEPSPGVGWGPCIDMKKFFLILLFNLFLFGPAVIDAEFLQLEISKREMRL